MKLFDEMTCPMCEEGKMRRIYKTLKFNYKGNTTEIEAWIYECDSCKEFLFDDNMDHDVEAILSNVRRKIDLG